MSRRQHVFYFVLYVICFAATNVNADNLKIGAIYSLSGFGASGGQGELNAVQLAVDEINAAGGIKNRKIELIVEDNQSGLTETASAVRKLSDIDKVSFLLGPNWAEFAEIAAPIAESSGILMLTSSGYVDGLVEGRDNVFTLMPNHSKAVEVFSEYLINLGPKKIVLLSSINSYYESITNKLVEQLKDSPVKISRQFAINPEDLDFRTVLARAQSLEPDFIVCFLQEGGVSYAFLKQARSLGLDFDSLLFGPSLAYDQAVLKDKSLAEGVVFFDYKDWSSKEFKKKYNDKYAMDPQIGSSKSYDSVYILKSAIEHCGFSVEKVRDCLKDRVYKGVTGEIAFDTDGGFKSDLKQTFMAIVKMAKFIPFKDSQHL